ncbi:MAG: hypothetical protein KIT10_06935 [Flavobacteriales bacterium]|nr:hypothetical protein [Flavobacteriales bacterium]
MRILLTFIAAVAFMASTSAQDVSTEKKARKADKTTAVSTTDAAPKAGCCAGKTAAASCSSKAGKAEASTDASTAMDAAATTEAAAAPKAACCAGMADADKKACCAGKTADKAGCSGKAEAHNHGDTRTEEAPAEQPNH